MLVLEWDEVKRTANIRKHGLDFLVCRFAFDGRDLLTRSSHRDGEMRYLTITCVRDVFIAIVWPPRGKAKRIISVRRARNGEKAEYQNLYGG